MSHRLYLYALPNNSLPTAREAGRNKRSGRRVSCAVIWTKRDGFQVFRSEEFRKVERCIASADEVIGFDLTGPHYTTFLRSPASEAPVVTDLFQLLSAHGEEPVSLRSVASATFGRVSLVNEDKLIELWNAGGHKRVIRACKRRAGLIRKVYEHVLLHRQFRFYDKDGHIVRIYMDPDVVPSGRFPEECYSEDYWKARECKVRARKVRHDLAAFGTTGRLPSPRWESCKQ